MVVAAAGGAMLVQELLAATDGQRSSEWTVRRDKALAGGGDRGVEAADNESRKIEMKIDENNVFIITASMLRVISSNHRQIPAVI